MRPLLSRTASNALERLAISSSISTSGNAVQETFNFLEPPTTPCMEVISVREVRKLRAIVIQSYGVPEGHHFKNEYFCLARS